MLLGVYGYEVECGAIRGWKSALAGRGIVFYDEER